MRVFLIALAFLSFAGLSASAETVSVGASKDNTLYEDAGGQVSNGQGIYLFTGKTGFRGGSELRRGLVAFDLTSIPANATVTAVTFAMFDSSFIAKAVNISLHKVARDWGEGPSNAGSPGGSGTQAQRDDATWLHNFFDTSRWAAAGGDFSSSSSATTAVNGTNRIYEWSGGGLVADVQSWITNPDTNFGWVIVGDEVNASNAQRFNTRENASNPPRLTVTYTVATPSPTPTPTPSATPTPTPTPTPTSARTFTYPVAFDLAGKAGTGLLAGNENAPINGTPGSGGEIGGGIVYNSQTRVLTINVAWGSGNGFTDLTGDAVRGGHIHGPTASGGEASFNENAPIIIGLNDKPGWNPSATKGGFSGSVTLTEAQAAHLFEGRLYLNFHTQVNPGGEIRGSLVQPPFDPANPIPAPIPRGPVRTELQQVASGLVSPTLLISAPDGSNRQFIVDQPGRIRIVQNGTLLATPFLDVSRSLVPLSPNYDERGLLGLVFDPDFNNPDAPGHRRLFTYSSEPVQGTADLRNQYATTINHHSVIHAWRVDASNPNRVDPASRQEILRIDQPQANHNGGHLEFGPDRLLYIALGDGGGANDNNQNGHNPSIGNGQDPDIALGKILRIDVNGANSGNGKYGIPAGNPFAVSGGVKEIFALGFRNPYRFSFNGNDLLAGDVGQRSVEELNRVEVGKNYGWRHKEGSFKFNPTQGTVSNDLSGVPEGLTDPIAQFDRDEGISIIGGYVYNSSAVPEWQGKYIFGEFSKSFSSPAGRLFYYDFTAAEIREFIIGRDNRALGIYVKGMGQDQNGDVYVLGSTTVGPSGTTGVVFKLVPVPTQLLNISTRVRVETGDNAMIGGFIVTGRDSKKVIVRAIGPSLAQAGVGDPLADPVMELRAQDGTLVAENDNWKDSQQTDIAASGLAPQSDAESAIVAMLSPAAYTAVVRGKRDATGVGLVEVYDLAQTAESKLANISTRGLVQSDTNVMIGGFIVEGGNASSRVIVRGIGPSLTSSGVTNPLADPTLELFDRQGTRLAFNDNWKDDAAQAAAITAAGIAPQNDAESALVITLPPGATTAVLAGRDGGTGVGLVEVYHLND
ncbi:MAG TPA: PQQ-dependent sugar dehydrogenase [Chthoniobacterales bacterium]|nr:PQQ-dependent sugar dehydrogenase [Chthoniobacterales bacterium]